MNNPLLVGIILPPILLLILEPLAWYYPRYIRLTTVLAAYFLIIVLLLGFYLKILIAVLTSIVFLLLLEPILWRVLYLARHPTNPLSDPHNHLPDVNIGQVSAYSMIIPRLLYWSYARKGWQGDFFYWNFHYRARLWETIVGTKPTTLSQIDEKTLIGQHITTFERSLGSYGMGGPGFFGITLSNQPMDHKILVYAVWGADSYMLLDGRLIRTYFLPQKGMPPEKEAVASLLVGAQITDIQLTTDRCTLHLIQDALPHTLEFTRHGQRFDSHADHTLPKGMAAKNAFETGTVSDYLILKNELGLLWV